VGQDAPVRFRIVGRGRAGGAVATAVVRRGWDEAEPVGRGDPGATLAEAGEDVDLVIVATPDSAIATTAAAIAPSADTVVAHLAGSLGLDALTPHPRRAAVHPLVSLPDSEAGAERLVGAWFAVAGDPVAGRLVDALSGRAVAVADEDRARYHAAACVAANHLVALLGQVERIAPAGVPLEAYLDLARGAVENVAALGPAAALTGPAARGDLATIERHLAGIDRTEHPSYEAMVAAAQRLAGSDTSTGAD
jgi:predicted short-subunit dehydrogenase-like oxidoreductase (DUF2520 family)